jgi:hypothetical protein
MRESHRLHRNSAFDRINYGGKFEQHAVAGGLDDATAMVCHQRVGDGAVFTESAGGSNLVEAH